MFTTKIINGLFKRVKTIIFPTTGEIVNQIFPMDSNVPEDVEIIRTAIKAPALGHLKDVPHSHRDGITNQEFQAYEHYHNSLMGL